MTQKSIKRHVSEVDGGGGVRSVSFNLTPLKWLNNFKNVSMTMGFKNI